MTSEPYLDDDETDDDDIDIEGIMGMYTPTSIFEKWTPTLSHISVSTIIQYRQCPLSFFFKNAINIDTSNIYMLAGIKLHEILENFYYNIAVPVPNYIEVLTDDGHSRIDIIPTKDGIRQYFKLVLDILADRLGLYEILHYSTSQTKTATDLYANALITLSAFAQEEAIRYLNTPTSLFKPVIIEGEVKYEIPDMPIPILGYIDVVLPSPEPERKELIPKDYKNRSDISGKLYDKIQAYTYALGIYKIYGYLPRKFIFKQIHGKNIKSPDILYDKNIYPILPETYVNISPKKLGIIENIIRSVYDNIMDKSTYKFHFDRDKCPNYFCPYRSVCLVNGFIHDEFIRPIHNTIANSRLEYHRALMPVIHIREGEEIDTSTDGFQTVGEYLGNA